LAAGASAAVLLAGCATGAPEYQPPALSTPTAFRGQSGEGGTASIADLPWASVFSDPALKSLIEEGLRNNYDLQVAIARIEQARALVGVARSQGKPTLDYQTFIGGQQVFVPNRDRISSSALGNLGATLNFAWEFDIWGRIKKSTEAARANLLAQEDVRHGVQLTLVADIAGGYYRLLSLDRQLAIAEDSAKTYQDTLGLFTRRFEAGRDSRLPVERVQANLEASRAQISDLQRAIGIQENALSTLVGGYPRGMPRGLALIDQRTPATPVGATTALLQRRPDILSAEQRMIQANADIGVALADQFPRLGLSALIGGQGVAFSGETGGLGLWSAGLNLAGPIFDGGRRREIYNERRAFWDETVAQYKKLTVTAFQETSDALTAQQNLAPQRAALERQVAALQRSVDLAVTRYDTGRADYFEVLEAQQQLYPAEDRLAQIQRDQLLAVVDLYKALGGGWTPDAAPTQTAQLH
jgi:multidrug efflux system outer membrane protein